MFRKYGILGILMIVFVEINFFFQLQPFANWYFPIIWFGYIFLIDALVYRMKGSSFMMNRPKQFALLLLISAAFWWLFELFNSMTIRNWSYMGAGGFGHPALKYVFGTLSFATVLPAVFETAELIKTKHVFTNTKLKHEHKITKELLHGMMFLGIVCFALFIIMPVFFYPLIWIAFFLLLDPVNYMHRQPSIIKHLKDRRLLIPLSLMLAGLVCGILWEFWNYWAIPKWSYEIPFVGFLKIFEMPILGYIGYLPFALEVYAMYYFIMGLLRHKKDEIML
jgi:hypothetical protein